MLTKIASDKIASEGERGDVRWEYWEQTALSRMELGILPPPDPEGDEGRVMWPAVARLLGAPEDELVRQVRYELYLRALDGPELRLACADHVREHPDLLRHPPVREIVQDAARRVGSALEIMVDIPSGAGRSAIVELLRGHEIPWTAAGYLPTGALRGARAARSAARTRRPRSTGTAADALLASIDATVAAMVLQKTAVADVTDYLLTLAERVCLSQSGLQVVWRETLTSD
ncbi:MAG: hypothetical protein QJR07_20800 [Acetobacteraceae bacterium]|nr:hypothetical protein [Acetobacteraceae bacterium]